MSNEYLEITSKECDEYLRRVRNECIAKYSHTLDGMACLDTYIKRKLICTHIQFVQHMEKFIKEQEAKKCEETK